jgi:hypothetical protein
LDEGGGISGGVRVGGSDVIGIARSGLTCLSGFLDPVDWPFRVEGDDAAAGPGEADLGGCG